jgi:hypothetical protein
VAVAVVLDGLMAKVSRLCPEMESQAKVTLAEIQVVLVVL